jgi:hypothetical protein
MNDSEEYEELKKDERKIYRKITNGVTRKEEEKLYTELDTIRRRKAKIRNRN